MIGAGCDARHREAAGFTLVEAAVTLAVIGIMALIAVPSLRGILPRLRLSSDTETLVKEIDLARQRAIARSEAFCVAFTLVDQGVDPTLRDAYAFGTWSGAGCAAIATSVLSQTDIASVEGLTVPGSSPAVATTTVVFQANGAVNVPPLVPGGTALNNAYITLRTPAGDRRMRIRIEPLGRLTTQRWLGGAAWADS